MKYYQMGRKFEAGGTSDIRDEVNHKIIDGYVYLLFLILLSLFIPPLCQADPVTPPGTVRDISPPMDVVEAVASEINNATTEVLIQAHSLRSKAIAQSIIEARKRGVTIEVILDKRIKNEKRIADNLTVQTDIPTYVDEKHSIAPNTIIVIIDRDILISGNINDAAAREKTELKKILILKGNKKKAEEYVKQFMEHKAHAEMYKEK